MPSSANRPERFSGPEVNIQSGGEQFFLTQLAGGPPKPVVISYARLSNGEEFPGITGYTGQNSPALSWTVGAVNYVWFRQSQLTVAPYYGIESDIGGFPLNDTDIVPLWKIDINGAGVFNSVIDARPWFTGVGGGDANSVSERLKEILQHSVMEDYLFDDLTSAANIDGISTGSFVGAQSYELAPGEFLQSNFASAPPDHLAVINQPFAAVLTNQLINATTDIQVKVSRVASPGAAFPGANPNWISVPANFSLVDLTSAPGTNVLNIAVRNNGASTYSVVGWGIYSNPVTSPGSVFQAGPGITIGSTGLEIINTHPKAAWILSDSLISFTWDTSVGSGRLSWSGAWRVAFWSRTTLFTNVVAGPSNLDGISADGYYVYIDLNLTTDGAAVVPVVSVTAPASLNGRIIIGSRRAGLFFMQGEKVLRDNAAAPGFRSGLIHGMGMDLNRWDAILAATAATFANRFATLADLGGSAITGVNAATVGAAPTVIGHSFGPASNYILLLGTTATIGSNSNSGSMAAGIIYIAGNLFYGVRSFHSSSGQGDNISPGVAISLGVTDVGFAGGTTTVIIAYSTTTVTLQNVSSPSSQWMAIGIR